MISRILSNTVKWILTKVLLLAASFYFFWNLSKNLQNKNLKDEVGENLIKSKTPTSGSLDSKEESDASDDYTSVDDMKIDIEEIEKALSKLLGPGFKEEIEREAELPIFILNIESQSDFFFSITKKSYVQVRNGTEVLPLYEDEKQLKIVPGLYVVNGQIININPDKVICLGWN
jgi:hypothetical protein